MIALSRYRRRTANFVAVAALVLGALLVDSCGVGQACTDIGCAGHGLDLVFDGDLAANSTLQIDIAVIEQGLEPSPVIHCELSNAAGSEQLLCNSYLSVSESGSRTLHTHEILLDMVRVTISSNGTVVSEQTVAPTYTHTTPNGSECGPVCTFATEHVDLAS